MSNTWLNVTMSRLAEDTLGTVLCLGRGGQACVDALPAGVAQHVVILEPDPKEAQRLQKKHGNVVTVLPVAFSDAEGTAQLHQFTMASVAALKRATGLNDLFPGLRTIGTLEVATQSAAGLVKHVNLDLEATHLLILGAPGEELGAVRQLVELDVLTRFEHILAPLPRVPLYEGSADGAALYRELETHGFRTQSQDTSDPDRLFAWLHRDAARVALAQECSDLATEVDTLRAALKTAQREIDQIRTKANAAHDTLSQERDDLRAEVEQLRADLKAAQQAAQTPDPQFTVVHAAAFKQEMSRLAAQMEMLHALLSIGEPS